MSTGTPIEQAAAAEFDTWALAGRGESMAIGHRDATGQLLDAWHLSKADRALDVGCGNGWAVRWMVDRGAGFGTGVDVSPKMIDQARQACRDDPRFAFHVASGLRLPLEDSSVSHVLSVESLYYYPDPGAALVEWYRVAKPGARLGIMVELYLENRGSHPWVKALDVDVHLLSADQYGDLARQAGWQDVVWRQVLDRRPVISQDQFKPSRYWPDYALYLAYREAGALLIDATKR
ncbi:MAG: class I SAM-dependent methyltransferase [Oligoflexia bacterium]|nr:class I SAM-dependent methyltransferase [Oligoflexia bacterium]